MGERVTMSISLSPRERERMFAHLCRAYPDEGCGVLLGREAEGERWVERADRHAQADTVDRVNADLQLGMLDYGRGRIGAARTFLRRALSLARKLGDPQSAHRSAMFLIRCRKASGLKLRFRRTTNRGALASSPSSRSAK